MECLHEYAKRTRDEDVTSCMKVLRLLNRGARDWVDSTLAITQLSLVVGNAELRHATAWARGRGRVMRLNHLSIEKCTNISPVALCTNLVHLDMQGCRGVDLHPLLACTHLQNLDLSRCAWELRALFLGTGVLSPLADCTHHTHTPCSGRCR